MPPVPTDELKIFDQESEADCSRPFTPSSGIRVMINNTAINKYGIQAESMDMFLLESKLSLISTLPVHSGSQSDLSGKSHTSSFFGTKNPAFTAETTMANPMSEPSIDGNSGPKTCATIT